MRLGLKAAWRVGSSSPGRSVFQDGEGVPRRVGAQDPSIAKLLNASRRIGASRTCGLGLSATWRQCTKATRFQGFSVRRFIDVLGPRFQVQLVAKVPGSIGDLKPSRRVAHLSIRESNQAGRVESAPWLQGVKAPQASGFQAANGGLIPWRRGRPWTLRTWFLAAEETPRPMRLGVHPAMAPWRDG